MIRAFLRAFLIVSLTAANVRFVAAGRWTPMFVTGFALSWVWWENAQLASRTDSRRRQAMYAAGAGVGTVFGAWLGTVL